MIEFTLPIETVSEANSTEHWSKKHVRHRSQKKLIWVWFLINQPVICLPCKITLIRLASRRLDSDNLQSAFKYIRDAISQEILDPTHLKSAGFSDSDPRITWHYDQKSAKSKGIKVQIEF